MMMSETVKLIECFQTYQGEGPDSGRRMLLVRFKNCTKNCDFCDTQVNMRINMEGIYTLDSLQERLDSDRLGLLITGGEPTHPKHFQDTMKLLGQLNYPVVNVETNGHNIELMIESVNNWGSHGHNRIKFIYSPKIFGEKDRYEATSLTNRLLKQKNVYIKYPFYNTAYDHEYCRLLRQEISDRERIGVESKGFADDRVWLMPIGANESEQKINSAPVMDACEKYKFNFSGRMHTIYDFL